MATCTAVLLDTVSIQRYVFGSNRLRENLGASNLVKEVYRSHLKQTLDEMKLQSNLSIWEKEPDTVYMCHYPQPEFEVGFIGGGKALLFFREIGKAKEVIKNWSRRLLKEAPGLSTAVAIKPDFDLCRFKDELQLLFKQLAANKNYYAPVNSFAGLGVTAACPHTGLTIEGRLDPQILGADAEEKERYVSAVTVTRINAAREEETQLAERYIRILNGKNQLPRKFTSRMEQLGQQYGEDSHIAIVHADVNGMGRRFQACESLEVYRKMAIDVNKYTEAAFDKLLEYVSDQLLDVLLKEESGFNISREKGEPILPLRPIVLGGEDVTFITEGRLGVHLAEKFLHYWGSAGILTDGKPLHACAGIAIVKTKYPFFRAYELAEQLCSAAKQEARRKGDSSWLDFHLSYGGISGSLQEIRAQQLDRGDYKLHFGPYQVIGNIANEDRDFSLLKQGMESLADEEIWPRSKVKVLRSTLYKGKEAHDLLIKDFKARGLTLPNPGYSNSSFAQTGFGGVDNNNMTPYHDMVELMEYYPLKILKEVQAK